MEDKKKGTPDPEKKKQPDVKGKTIVTNRTPAQLAYQKSQTDEKGQSSTGRASQTLLGKKLTSELTPAEIEAQSKGAKRTSPMSKTYQRMADAAKKLGLNTSEAVDANMDTIKRMAKVGDGESRMMVQNTADDKIKPHVRIFGLVRSQSEDLPKQKTKTSGFSVGTTEKVAPKKTGSVSVQPLQKTTKEGKIIVSNAPDKAFIEVKDPKTGAITKEAK
jgi:hypothetical protein